MSAEAASTMGGMNAGAGAVVRELHDVDATGYKRVVQIRITTDALAGSIMACPITPERARTLGRMMAVRDEQRGGYCVVADPMDYEAMAEVLIHPADWHALLRDAPHGAVALPLQPSAPIRMFGVPVVHT